MNRNTTFNLPDDLLRRAKAYAAENGTTVTALIRSHLEKLTHYTASHAVEDDPALAFSEGRISKERAMAALGLRDYSELLMALGERDLPLPRLPAHQEREMTEKFLKIRREIRS